MSDTVPAPLAPPRIVPAGEAALLVELGDEIGEAATDRVLRLANALDALGMLGIIDRVPGYTTLLVVFDPASVDPDRLSETLVRLDREAVSSPLPAGRMVTIPVAYGGDFGPDLKTVA
jgi:allophanate hydrolase subunit 1